MTTPDPPKPFDFVPPRGYQWLLSLGLPVFDHRTTVLAPWYFFAPNAGYEITEGWPGGPHPGRLFGFARRYDGDDIACFEINDQRTERVLVVHAWTNEGYDIEFEYSTFWEWLKAAIDDISILVERS